MQETIIAGSPVEASFWVSVDFYLLDEVFPRDDSGSGGCFSQMSQKTKDTDFSAKAPPILFCFAKPEFYFAAGRATLKRDDTHTNATGLAWLASLCKKHIHGGTIEQTQCNRSTI